MAAGVDYEKLTILDLRRQLEGHGIAYPRYGRKSVLIKLLKAYLEPEEKKEPNTLPPGSVRIMRIREAMRNK